jgi:hypothetical protein
MASTSGDIERVLMKAAKSPSAKNDGSWSFLETCLEFAGIDISLRSESEWMEPYKRYRQFIEEIKIEESRTVRGRCSPPEKSDAVSFTDSAIHLDDKVLQFRILLRSQQV